MRERADDDVSCLQEQGAQRYANTYVDRQVGKTIKMLGRSFIGPSPSTEYINTFRPVVLNSSPGDHLLCTFRMSPLFNTPD